MLSFVIRRTLSGLLTLFVIATLCFCVTRITPGSPFSTERGMDEQTLKNFERHYGLDQPFWVQYGRAMKGYLQGKLGPSTAYHDYAEVGDFVWPSFRTSLALGSLAATLAFLIGIPLGLFAAARQNRWPDHLGSSISVLGICVPNFLLGPLLVLVFTFGLRWLPSAEWPQSWTDGKELLKLIMPSITLAMAHVAYIARLTRAGMLDVVSRDFIRTARAKGLSEGAVFLKHVLKNGITPVVSYAGPMVAVILTGSIVVERIFVVPGLGKWFIESARNRDMNLIMACVLVYGSLIIVLNMLVDLLYAWLDPRVRLDG